MDAGLPCPCGCAAVAPEADSQPPADRLATQALGLVRFRSIETFGTSGDLLHAAAVIRSNDGRATGVVVATDYLTGEVAMRSRRMTQAFESYNQLRVLRRPLTGLYLSFFLMVTLLILFGATWMGSYLAKRITRPVLMLSAAAREIGAGRLDQHVESQSNDEFGALVDAFNAMAGELATSRRKIDRSTIDLERNPSVGAALHRDDPERIIGVVGRCRRAGDDDRQRRGGRSAARNDYRACLPGSLIVRPRAAGGVVKAGPSPIRQRRDSITRRGIHPRRGDAAAACGALVLTMSRRHPHRSVTAWRGGAASRTKSRIC